MGILGIDNRTENWKTAKTLLGLSEQGKSELVKRLSPDGRAPSGEIKLELFWYGMRDYIDQPENMNTVTIPKVVYRYDSMFSELCEQIESFEWKSKDGRSLKFSPLKDHNYDVSKPEHRGKLYDNLTNTEIDIVLQTPDHLFIGEAKDESRLGAKPSYVLVHQLIRQYVMAKILVAFVEPDKDKRKGVVPFVVGDGDRIKSIKNTGQVNFMIRQGWLNEENILSWDCIEQIARGD